jgi:uncharacterized membrane protein YccF (DUF307 family)
MNLIQSQLSARHSECYYFMSLTSLHYTMKAFLVSKQYKSQQLICVQCLKFYSSLSELAWLLSSTHSYRHILTIPLCFQCLTLTHFLAQPVPEERVPWEPEPQRRASQTRSTSTTVTKVNTCRSVCMYKHKHVLTNIHFIFQVVTSFGMQQSKEQEAADTAPRRITLMRGGLQLAVSFPANSAIRLQDGQLNRVLQREYCECKARSTSRETIKRQ